MLKNILELFGKKEFEDKSSEAIDRYFSPEFRNRLNAIVQFNSLSNKVVERIVDKIISQLQERLVSKKIKIELTPEARSFIADTAYDPLLGARPIQRFVDSEITERLTNEILFGKLMSGGDVRILLEDNTLVVRVLDS